MPETSTEPFRPTRLVLKPTTVKPDMSDGEGLAIFAEADDGKQQGVVVPMDIGPLLMEFLPTSGPRFVAFWQEYESTRGGDCFFWDLTRLATVIQANPSLPVLRKLSGAVGPYDFMHNAYQAQLMGAAHQRFPGGVALVRASSVERRPDFTVTTEGELLSVEVKVLTRLTGVEIYDHGWRLIVDDRQSVVQQLRAKLEDGLQQTGPDGVVVIAIWCDNLGACIVRACSEWECSLGEIFTPATAVIACRDEAGQDRWLSFPFDQRDARIRELDERLGAFSSDAFSIPVNSGIVSVVNSDGWMSVGRMVKIANYTTPVDYSSAELSSILEARPLVSVPLGQLVLWQARWTLIEQQVVAFTSTTGQMERRKYTIRELLALPAGVALMQWSALLHPVIREAFETDGSRTPLISSELMGRDYAQLRDWLVKATDAFWLSPDIASFASLIAILVSDKAMFGALRRLTGGYGTLLRDEIKHREDTTNATSADANRSTDAKKDDTV